LDDFVHERGANRELDFGVVTQLYASTRLKVMKSDIPATKSKVITRTAKIRVMPWKSKIAWDRAPTKTPSQPADAVARVSNRLFL
jgi:hypothetical protein